MKSAPEAPRSSCSRRAREGSAIQPCQDPNVLAGGGPARQDRCDGNLFDLLVEARHQQVEHGVMRGIRRARQRIGREQDRKSTRLNSSHVKISYAVFCLKKKKKTKKKKQSIKKKERIKK